MGVTVDSLYTLTAADACNTCHKTGGAGPTFAALHKGFNDQIYADAASANTGTKFSATRKAQVDSASYDAAAHVATVSFSVSGVSTTAAVVNPTVVASLYGFDTKDFIVSGHGARPTPSATSSGPAAARRTARASWSSPARTRRPSSRRLTCPRGPA